MGPLLVLGKQKSPDALQKKQYYAEPYANNTPSNVSDKHQSQRLVHIRLGRVVLLVALLVVVFVALTSSTVVALVLLTILPVTASSVLSAPNR